MDPKQMALAALSEELLTQLRWMLNLPVSATAEEIKAELDKLKAQIGADGTAAASINLLGILQAKDAQIAALTAQAGQPDPASYAPVAGLPLNDANFNAAYDAMTAFKADGGRPLGIKPTLLVVPTTLRTQAAEVVQVARRADGSDNPNANIVEVLSTPWLN